MSRGHVLSIMSHVVHGYVGNKCVILPLQIHDFEVDFINSVQLSNHTGYPNIKGQILNSQDLSVLYEGLKENKIHKYSHILTGYVGKVDFLQKLAEIIQDLKKVNPDAVYVCDPVMGDNGVFYVPEELADLYREKIVALADVLTPNQFELGVLTQMTIETEEDALRAIDKLHDLGVPTIILTSAKFHGNSGITCIASRKSDNARYRVEMPWLDATFTGTGDLFTALTLANLGRDPNDIESALSRVVSTMQAIIKDTYDHYKLNEESQKELCRAAKMELRLVHNWRTIIDPPATFTCKRIS